MTKKQTVQRTLIAHIKSGILTVGDKLPSLREITANSGISIFTALDAYNDLVSYGILESRPKNGYFILTDDNAKLDMVMRKLALLEFPPPVKLDDVEQERIILNYTRNSFLPYTKNRVQLMSESVSPEFFDNNELIRLFIKAVRSLTPGEGGKIFTESDTSISLAISKWMLPLGCIFQRKLLCVTSNLAEALILAIRSCYRNGEYVAVESPGDTNFYRALRFLNIRYIEIRSDPVTGLSVEDLDTYVSNGIKFSCVLLSPNHSNPTGAIMPEESRLRLILLCRSYEIAVIENDMLGRLSFSTEPLRPLKTLDHENVIVVSDLSKILGEDFNLGFIEAGKYSDRLAFIKSISGNHVPLAFRNCIAEYMSTPMFRVHVAGLRRNLKTAVTDFSEALTEKAPDSLKIYPSRGGPYLWCEMPEGKSVKEFLDISHEENLLLAPGRVFSALDDADRFFRVNCCTIRVKERVIHGADTLASALRRYL